MRGHAGYFKSGPVENDVRGCGHCQRQIDVKPGQVSTPIAMCRCCMSFICGPCDTALQSGTCTTWEKRFEAAEKRHEARSRFLNSIL